MMTKEYEQTKLYQRCEREFLKQIAITTDITLKRHVELDDTARTAMLKDVLFGVAAHISDSANNGKVDDVDLFVRLGFCLGWDEHARELEGPSGLHEWVGEVVDAAFGEDAADVPPPPPGSGARH